MTSYIGNNKKLGDCVIVGVYNALAFLGRRVAYWKIEDVAINYFNYTPSTGFPTENLDDFFRFWEIDNELLDATGQVEKHILNGNCSVAIIKSSEKSSWHFIFLKPGENRTIEVINDYRQWVDIVLEHSRKELQVAIWNVGKVA